MGSGDHHAVVASDARRRQRYAAEPPAGEIERGNERIAVIDARAPIAERLHDIERGTLARVIDVGLVGHAQHQDSSSVHGPPVGIEAARHEVHDVLRHVPVHVSGQLDETRLEPAGACLP